MKEIYKYLYLDVLTVTGRTIGANLENLENDGFFKNRYGELNVYGISKEEIIRPTSNPIHAQGAIAILKGNLAPDVSPEVAEN
jgi:dihydroxy-acid dehydratase